MNNKLKASLIVFAATIPVGIYDQWIMNAGKAPFDIYLAAGGFGVAFGFCLLPWLLIVLRKSPTAGYVTAALIAFLLSVGASNVGKHSRTNTGSVSSPAEHVRVG